MSSRRGTSFVRRAATFVGVVAPVALAASCLLTSTPQFTAQPHTAPFLVEATASPSPAQLVIIDLAKNPTAQVFEASVVSQDDPTGNFSIVHSSLFIDFNSGTVGEPPYFQEPFPGTALTQPGSLTETTGRQVSASWPIARDTPPLGCHTATLIASHHFDTQTECPCVGDYSQITWQVLVCDSSSDATSCSEVMLASCAWQEMAPANNCLVYEKAFDDGGTDCPSPDAGTP